MPPVVMHWPCANTFEDDSFYFPSCRRLTTFQKPNTCIGHAHIRYINFCFCFTNIVSKQERHHPSKHSSCSVFLVSFFLCGTVMFPPQIIRNDWFLAFLSFFFFFFHVDWQEYSKSQIVGLVTLVATMKGWKRKTRLEILEKIE